MSQLTHASLSVPHGFFTRIGGVSEGIYASLNASPLSRDDASHVAENRTRIAAQFDQPPKQLLTLSQIHSATCLAVTQLYPVEESPEADALVTNTPGLVLGVLTADCVPVLLHDPVAGVIGAAHAGWKGALAGIVQATIAAMESYGATPSNIIAVTGPSIAQESYEVDASFRMPFLRQSRESADLFSESPHNPATHFMFDNKRYVARQLRECGVEQIHTMPEDTYADEARFFSFRRATHRGESDYGRQLSAIMLPEAV